MNVILPKIKDSVFVIDNRCLNNKKIMTFERLLIIANSPDVKEVLYDGKEFIVCPKHHE